MGNLFVTDFGNAEIFERTAAGNVSVFSDDTILANGKKYDSPESIAIDPSGTEMYVSDGNRHGTDGGIMIIDATTGVGTGFLPIPSSSGYNGEVELDWLAWMVRQPVHYE